MQVSKMYIYIAHRRNTSNTLDESVYIMNRNVFKDCLKLFPPIAGIPQAVRQGIPDRRTSHKKPVGCRCWAGRTVGLRLGAVGWRIGDVAAMRHLRLVTISRGMEALDRAGSWTPWRRVYTTCSGTTCQCSSVCRSRESRQASVELDHTGCGVQHSLQYVGRRFRRTRQDSVAIVNARQTNVRVWRGRRFRVEWTPRTLKLK